MTADVKRETNIEHMKETFDKEVGSVVEAKPTGIQTFIRCVFGLSSDSGAHSLGTLGLPGAGGPGTPFRTLFGLFWGSGPEGPEPSVPGRGVPNTKLHADLDFQACISFLRSFRTPGTPIRKILVHTGNKPLCLVPYWPQIMQTHISFRTRSELVLDADHSLDLLGTQEA